ncbi:MAG TPA: glycosyltransferase family 39 protein [Solirubrobacteraceae bacterium]|jgi:4-amino-4-deoxy-L-arabinose transferase-like glycosyltransferase|nr:glycosyltransferase family 39 protein [Solirubrobacteraceae bacterium]
MTMQAETTRPTGAGGGLIARFAWLRCSAASWAAVAIGALFIAATCWWLSQDRSVPIDDAALHLGSALDAYSALSTGRLLSALTGSAPYPPLTFLVGALGVPFGGVGVAPPIIAQNLVYVPLLALGCYKVARLAFGPLAGLLAVVFALGSPMVIEEFHEFMLDAPEAAMVAVALWAIMATERFSRPGVCALAGVAVGFGMLTKETFVIFVAGAALATAVRGGRRAWRGAAVFAAVALAIALPWYLYELSAVHRLGSEAFGSSSSVSAQDPGIAPPRLSRANLEWYFWSLLNWQLYLPLFAFSAAGWIWTMAGFARRRPVSRFAPELALGAFVSWAALTGTYVHDPRYSIPLTVYLAVFGAGWISRLPRPAVAVAAGALVFVALANSLGDGFGIGGRVASGLQNPTYIQQPGNLTIFANYGFWVGPPTRDGDTLGLFQALHRNGVQAVRWYSAQETEIEFSSPGIALLARIAGLRVPPDSVNPAKTDRRDAFLLHRIPEPGLPKPCITLRDGSGVWVGLGGSKAWTYCPPHPS